MVEAGQTTVAPVGIWAIVIVAVLLLGFWLTAVMLADRSQVRASGRARSAGASWRVTGGEAVPPGETPTRADIPVQPGPERPGMPRQRTGDADRAARSHARPDDERSPS
jgi:hypothetical protein